MNPLRSLRHKIRQLMTGKTRESARIAEVDTPPFNMDSELSEEMKERIRQRPPLNTIEGVIWHYNTYLDDYEATYGPIIQAHRPTNVEELLELELDSMKMEDGMHILDAGIGTCGPAIWFAERRNVTITGVSLPGSIVERGEAAVAKAGLSDRIKIKVGDFHYLPDLFPEKTFDRVMFLETIGYAHALGKVLSGVHHVLKPGGYVYIKDWYLNEFEPGNEKDVVTHRIKDLVMEEYGYDLTPKASFLKTVQDSGLEIITERLSPIKLNADVMFSFDKRVGNTWLQYSKGYSVTACEIQARRVE